MEVSWEWMVVGTLGIWCIEASYVPQLVRLWRRKHAEDISPAFPGLNLLCRILAMTYAVHLGEAVLAVGFFVGAFLRLAFLIQVVWYRSPRPTDSAGLVRARREG
jgi:uncharacterized protein with PQ loop repeat